MRHRETVARLRDGAGLDLPARLSLFGHTRIPVIEVELLAALGEQRDVHLWLPQPSDALWRALGDTTGSVARRADGSHERVGHPLLASLGRDLRELQRGLNPVVEVAAATADLEHPGHPARLAPVRPRRQHHGRPQRRVVGEDDTSVQVHACHGPARQVEVLREVLLGLLADDPTLSPATSW